MHETSPAALCQRKDHCSDRIYCGDCPAAAFYGKIYLIRSFKNSDGFLHTDLSGNGGIFFVQKPAENGDILCSADDRFCSIVCGAAVLQLLSARVVRQQDILSFRRMLTLYGVSDRIKLVFCVQFQKGQSSLN